MSDTRQVTVAGARARPVRPMREWIGLAIVAAGALVGLVQCLNAKEPPPRALQY